MEKSLVYVHSMLECCHLQKNCENGHKICNKYVGFAPEKLGWYIKTFK